MNHFKKWNKSKERECRNPVTALLNLVSFTEEYWLLHIPHSTEPHVWNWRLFEN